MYREYIGSFDMKTIITIQHPQSIHHTNGMVGSQTDWDLSELGIIQADNIAKKLKEELDDSYLLYSSDLLRCKHTADIIGKYLDIKPIYKKELRERHLGKACGKSVKWLRENKECEEYTADDRLFSDAESRRDVYERLKPFVDEIINNQQNIIIVSHGELLSIFNNIFHNQSIEIKNKIYPSGSVSKYIVDGDKRVIEFLGDTSYI